MSDIYTILEERGKTHGKFSTHAHVTQTLKNVIQPYSQKLSTSQKEALDMILHKIGRVCAGNPNEVDHWRDIAGYATLVAKELENEHI